MKCPPIKVSKQFSNNDKVSKVMWYFPLSVIDADFLFFPCPSMSILFISCFLLAILVKMNGESNSFQTIFQVSLWQKVIQITVTFHIEENIGIKNRTTNIASGFCHFVPTKPKENNWKAKIFGKTWSNIQSGLKSSGTWRYRVAGGNKRQRMSSVELHSRLIDNRIRMSVRSVIVR